MEENTNYAGYLKISNGWGEHSLDKNKVMDTYAPVYEEIFHLLPNSDVVGQASTSVIPVEELVEKTTSSNAIELSNFRYDIEINKTNLKSFMEFIGKLTPLFPGQSMVFHLNPLYDNEKLPTQFPIKIEGWKDSFSNKMEYKILEGKFLPSWNKDFTIIKKMWCS